MPTVLAGDLLSAELIDETPSGRVNTAVHDYESKHSLRFLVSDPSAIGAIATVLERNGVGVVRAAAVWAKSETGQHHIRLLTHSGPRRAVEASLRSIAEMGIEKGKNIVLPVAQ